MSVCILVCMYVPKQMYIIYIHTHVCVHISTCICIHAFVHMYCMHACVSLLLIVCE